MTNDML